MKTFEQYINNDNNIPEKGDYIIDDENDIGEIVDINYFENNICYIVKFFDVFINTRLQISNIFHFGTKEEMNIILQSNKYNL